MVLKLIFLCSCRSLFFHISKAWFTCVSGGEQQLCFVPVVVTVISLHAVQDTYITVSFCNFRCSSHILVCAIGKGMTIAVVN